MRWLTRLFRKPKPISPRYNITTYDEDYIKEFVIQWSLTYPIDRWWRERHKIAFNSPAHREVSFLDMRFEFEEYLLNNKTIETSSYIPNKGEYLKNYEDVLTEEEKVEQFEQDFRNTDLSQFDD